MLEVQTPPLSDEFEIRRSLHDVLQALVDEAEDEGKHVVALGTPLDAASPPVTSERGRLFEQIYGPGVTSAKNCAGTHVHFDREDATRQLNLLTALDAALPSQLVRLATDARRLVRQADRKPVEVGRPGVTSDRIAIPPFEDLRRLSEDVERLVDAPEPNTEPELVAHPT